MPEGCQGRGCGLGLGIDQHARRLLRRSEDYLILKSHLTGFVVKCCLL